MLGATVYRDFFDSLHRCKSIRSWFHPSSHGFMKIYRILLSDIVLAVIDCSNLFTTLSFYGPLITALEPYNGLDFGGGHDRGTGNSSFHVLPSLKIAQQPAEPVIQCLMNFFFSIPLQLFLNQSSFKDPAWR